MDISLLKTFLEVAKTRHFGRAADNLFITQSAASARIKLLEQTLGVQVFIRKRNDLQLTPAGSRLQQHAASLLKGWERARQAVALDSDVETLLAVGCVFDMWKIYVEAWSQSLQKTSPETALQIDILMQETLIQRLTLGMLDLAFMFDPPQTPDLELKQVAEVPLILVSKRRRISLDTAMQKHYVLVDWGSAFGVQHAELFPDIPSPMMRTNSGQVALDWILNNGGTAYLPRSLVKTSIKQNLLYEVKDAPVINRYAYLVYRPEHMQKDVIQHAIKRLPV